MNNRTNSAAVALGVLAAFAWSQAANALPVITFTQDQLTVPADVINPPASHTGNFTLSTTGSISNVQSSPFEDNTSPYSCLACGTGAGTATYDIVPGAGGFSIFWGSPDAYNSIEFFDGSTPVNIATIDSPIITGSDLLPPQGSGHNLVTFSFNGLTVTSVVLSDSGEAAFEYSDVTSTPLPAALPLFMGGVGLIGLLSRRRKRKVAGLAAA